MKKVLSTLLALTLCASMLAGCGGNSNSSSSAADSSASESSSSTSSASSESSASESESSSEASAEGTSASGPITVVSRLPGGCVVSIKDGRYNIDNQLASAVEI